MNIVRTGYDKRIAGVRIWRLFLYTDRTTFSGSLRHGGIMLTRGGKRELAKFVAGRVCFISEGWRFAPVANAVIQWFFDRRQRAYRRACPL